MLAFLCIVGAVIHSTRHPEEEALFHVADVENTEALLLALNRLQAHFPMLEVWVKEVSKGIEDQTITVAITTKSDEMVSLKKGVLWVNIRYFGLDAIEQETLLTGISPIRPGFLNVDPEIAAVPK